MNTSIEATGKTVEEAISAGLEKLDNAAISDVDVVVLEEGSKGLFGLFGSRPAKVRLTMKNADEEDPLADIFSDREPEKIPETQKPKAKPQEKPQPRPAVKPAAETAEPAGAPETEKSKKSEKPAGEKQEQKRPAPVQRTARPKSEKPRKQPKPAQPEKPAEEAERELPPKQPPVKPLEKAEVTPIPEEELDPESAAGKAQAFLKEITGLMGVPVEVAMGRDAEGNLYANMSGDPQGILIGRRGETLDALQYLVSLKINRGQEEYTRITLDTENYRAKREDTLIRLANRMANRAVRSGRKVSLEPMNPYERRIIHSALQPNELVDTHSEGEEPNRRVVITLRK